jgi:hemerythrin
MQPIIWDERLATGDPAIDAQHQELHDLVMELGMLAEEVPDRVALGEVIFEILAYAAVHFSDEEALMERIGFPGLARQKVLHSAFAEEVSDLAAAFVAGDDRVTASAVQARLQQWLLHHVWEEDLQFAAYIRPRGN